MRMFGILFFLNNVKTISSVISDKITELHKMSETLCPNESAEPFAYSITFEDVTNLYTIFNRTPALIGLLLAIICYALLLFPYALQTRNTKVHILYLNIQINRTYNI